MSRSSGSSVRETVSKIRKMARKEMKRATKAEIERAAERVTERVMKCVMKQKMEPMIERFLKKVMKKEEKRAKKPAMEQMMKLAKQRVMEPAKKLAKKRAMEPAKKQAKKRAKKQATESAMEPNFSTQDATADCIQRTPPDHPIQKLEQREFQLLFANKLPKTIDTRCKIADENGGNIEIKLIDIISKETVEKGPLSSIDIDIEILNGDLGFEGHENWTEQEFDAKIVHPRPNKGPLVEGKHNITFKNGVGTIDDLSFSDNSSWIMSGEFRLGARVARDLQCSRMGQPRIKEAISEPFAVMDHHEKSSTGMENDKNHASSSHNIGFTIAGGINLDLALSPPTNDDSGPGSHLPLWNSSQSNTFSNLFISQEAEPPYISPTIGPLLQEMQNANNHASSHLNLYGDLPLLNDLAEVELHNNPATDPQPHQLPLTDHQGSVGMLSASQSGSSQSIDIGSSLSPDTQRFLIETFQNSDGQHSICPASQNSQNTVMPPGSSFLNLWNHSL